MATSITTSDIGWQWRQTQQRLAEWIELQLNQPSQPGTKPAGGWSLQWLAPYITTILVLLLLGLLLFIVLRGVRGWQTRRAERQFVGDPLGVTAEPVVSQQEWLTRSRQHQRQGNFTQAARALYFALLQNLHDRQLIPEKRSRTDQEYAAMTQELAQSAAFETLFQTHEQIEFAGQQLSAQDYERCQQAYGVTDQAIAAATAKSPSPRRSGGSK